METIIDPKIEELLGKLTYQDNAWLIELSLEEITELLQGNPLQELESLLLVEYAHQHANDALEGRRYLGQLGYIRRALKEGNELIANVISKQEEFNPDPYSGCPKVEKIVIGESIGLDVSGKRGGRQLLLRYRTLMQIEVGEYGQLEKVEIYSPIIDSEIRKLESAGLVPFVHQKKTGSTAAYEVDISVLNENLSYLVLPRIGQTRIHLGSRVLDAITGPFSEIYEQAAHNLKEILVNHAFPG